MFSNWSRSRRTAEKHLSRGKLNAAIDEYRILVSWDPTDLCTLNILGDLYARAGLNEEAVQAFWTVARGYDREGFAAKASAVLKKILRIDPANSAASERLAESYVAQGQTAEAARQYVMIAEAHERDGRGDKSLQAYQKAALADTSNTSLLVALAERRLRDGHTHIAHETFITAAQQFVKQGLDQQALSAYEKARSINPDDRATLSAMVSICTTMGESETAISMISEAIDNNPGDSELHQLLASTYLAAGREDDAYRTFRALADLDQNAHHGLFAVCEKFLVSGDLDRAAQYMDEFIEELLARREEQEAINFLHRILEKDPGHNGSLRRLALIYRRLREDFNLVPILGLLAQNALKRGDYDEAIDLYREVSELEPWEPRHRQALHQLGATADEFTFALLEPSPRLDGSSQKREYKNAVKQARLLYCNGKKQDAIIQLQQLVICHPDNLAARIILKDIYAREGMRDLAANQSLHIGRIQYANRASSKYSSGMSTGAFDHLSEVSLSSREVADIELQLAADNRRRSERTLLRIPLVVRSQGWREFTETIDISGTGLRVQLAHPVRRDAVVSLEMPRWPEELSRYSGSNATAMVRHIRRTPTGVYLVGFEL